MYCLFLTDTKELLLKIIQSSIESYSVDLGMVKEVFKVEIKTMVCENVCNKI
jgi:hypothetical protein